MIPPLDEPWLSTGTHDCGDCGAECRDAICPECAAIRNAEGDLAQALDDLCDATRGRGDYTVQQQAIGRIVKAWEAKRERERAA